MSGPSKPAPVGNWGGMSQAGNSHITQTNQNAKVGVGAHVTTHLPDSKGAVVHDNFDSNGNFKNNDFGIPKK